MRYSEITGELRSNLTKDNNLSDVNKIIEQIDFTDICKATQVENEIIVSFDFAGETKEFTAMNFGFAEWIAGFVELSGKVNHNFVGLVEISKPEYRVMQLKVSGKEVLASVINDPDYFFGELGEEKSTLVHVSRRFTNNINAV